MKTQKTLEGGSDSLFSWSPNSWTRSAGAGEMHLARGVGDLKKVLKSQDEVPARFSRSYTGDSAPAVRGECHQGTENCGIAVRLRAQATRFGFRSTVNPADSYMQLSDAMKGKLMQSNARLSFVNDEK